jgi:serine/threonine-protein kinase
MDFRDDLDAEIAARKGMPLGDGWNLVQVLNIGGTGTLWEARNEAGQKAAVKLLHTIYVCHDEVRTRFVREGKATNSIEHRGVLRVFKEGALPDGTPWLMMPLLVGESLEERWERKGHKLQPGEVLWIADQLLAVLGAAHARGIVHRDVKPDNVFITTEGHLYLLDFGVARVRDALEATDDATRDGTVLGTPGYLAPEQARGDSGEIGVRTDLWAVGATMFTLLSGRLVHEGARFVDQLVAAATKPAPSVQTVVPDLPRQIVHLVDYSLVWDNRGRWPSARAMRHAVRLAYTEWKLETEGRPEELRDTFLGLTGMTGGPARLEPPPAPTTTSIPPKR